MKRRSFDVSVKKATRLSIVTNSIQVSLMVVLLIYLIFTPGADLNDATIRYIVIAVCALLAVVSSLDIRDALMTGRVLEQLDAMGDTLDNMSQFNITLRAQRHDFLNHLQVVYSLMEMQEYDEANAYIEKVYGKITSVSRVMKTAIPAVNALLQVKTAAFEKQGAQVNVSITSTWEELSMPEWEMCKVLSNLLDNAMDAMSGEKEKVLTVTITEDLHNCCFSISNTGPVIPEKMQTTIFIPGITTKGSGHGMGLHIVKTTMENAGGSIRVKSYDHLTTFSGSVPKKKKETIPA